MSDSYIESPVAVAASRTDGKEGISSLSFDKTGQNLAVMNRKLLLKCLELIQR